MFNLADSESSQFKIKITGNTPADDNAKDIEIIVPLKYLSKCWKTLDIPLIICKVNTILTRPPKCYVPVVTLSTQNYFSN